MGYASINGRARTDPKKPVAQAVCDRCGLWYSITDLVWQHAWRGNDLVDIRLRVCTLTCLDIPFENNRPLYLPPDPTPVDQPRVENFAIDENYEAWDQSDLYWDSGLDWDATGSANTNIDGEP